MTFAAYISCFCTEFSFVLVTLTFDLLALAMADELSFAGPMLVPIFSILQLSVPELFVTQSDRSTFTWSGECACVTSRDLSPGTKIIHIFDIPEPNLPIYFVTFRALRRRLSPVICKI